MSHSMRPVLFLGLVALILGVAMVLVVGKNIELVATTELLIGAEATDDPSTTRTVAIIEKGVRLRVLSCEDLKHYFVPEVQLSNGGRGYVIGGQFELTRSMPTLTFDKPIVFSCL